MESFDQLPDGYLYVDKLFNRRVEHRLFYNPDSKTLIRKWITPGSNKDLKPYRITNNKKYIPVKFLSDSSKENIEVKKILNSLSKHYSKWCSKENKRLNEYRWTSEFR